MLYLVVTVNLVLFTFQSMLDLVFILVVRHMSLVMGNFSVFMHLLHLSNRRQMMMEFRLLVMMHFCGNIEVVSIVISVNWFVMRGLVYHKVRFKMM